MEGLSALTKQKLIDYKNKLKSQSVILYYLGSIEENKIEEAKLILESDLKEKIAKELENIIYGE